jgi:hypothetical protein
MVQPSFGSLSEAPVPSLFDTFKKDIKDASKSIFAEVQYADYL